MVLSRLSRLRQNVHVSRKVSSWRGFSLRPKFRFDAPLGKVLLVTIPRFWTGNRLYKPFCTHDPTSTHTNLIANKFSQTPRPYQNPSTYQKTNWRADIANDLWNPELSSKTSNFSRILCSSLLRLRRPGPREVLL